MVEWGGGVLFDWLVRRSGNVGWKIDWAAEAGDRRSVVVSCCLDVIFESRMGIVRACGSAG